MAIEAVHAFPLIQLDIGLGMRCLRIAQTLQKEARAASNDTVADKKAASMQVTCDLYDD